MIREYFSEGKVPVKIKELLRISEFDANKIKAQNDLAVKAKLDGKEFRQNSPTIWHGTVIGKENGHIVRISGIIVTPIDGPSRLMMK